MNQKNLLKIYGIYIPIILQIASILAMLSKNLFFMHTFKIISIATLLIFLPLILLVTTFLIPSFSKIIRVFFFNVFRVNTFAFISIIIVLTLSIIFIYNYFSLGFNAEQIFLNVFILNLIILFLAGLILANRFKITEPLDLLIQEEGREEVFLYIQGILRHIPDPSTFQLLGYSWDDIQIISEKEFHKYKKETPLESVKKARIIQGDKEPEVYMLIGNEKRHIPDPTTLEHILELGKRDIEIEKQKIIDQWKTGRQLSSIVKIR